MTSENESDRTTATIWRNARSIATVRNRRITLWKALIIRKPILLKSVITLAGIRRNAPAVLTRSLTNWSALRVRLFRVPRKARTLPRLGTNSQNTLHVAHRKAPIPPQLVSFSATALVRRAARSVDATPLANG